MSDMFTDLRDAYNRVEKEANDTKLAEAQESVRNQLPTMRETGYPEDQYNYAQRMVDGHAALDKPDAPPKLQNKYIKPATAFVAGNDLATGDKIVNDFADGGGFVSRGTKQLQESYKTPDLAPPPQDLAGLTNLAFGAVSEGIHDYEGFSAQVPSWPDEHKKLAWQAAQQNLYKLDLQNKITKGDIDHEEIKEPKFPVWTKKATYDEVHDHPNFSNLSKEFYRELSGREWEGDDKTAADFGMWWLSAFNWNLTYQADMAARAKFTKNDKLKKLMGTMLTIDENMEMSWDQSERNYASLVLDPANLLPFGKIGGLLSKKAIAAQMAKYVGQDLTRMQVAKVAARGAMNAGAPIGAGFAGLDEYLRETVKVESGRQEKLEPASIATAAAAGTVLGGGLGAVAAGGAQGIDPTIEFGKQIYKAAMENARRAPPNLAGSPRAQRGAVGTDINKYPYRGNHKAPNPSYGAQLHDLTTLLPDDIYSKNAVQYYGTGDRKLDKASVDVIHGMRDKPDGEVTVYRAVPKGVKDINAGDWVSINKDYAASHGDAWVENGQYDVIEKKVPASELWTTGDSIHEWGYHPKEDAVSELPDVPWAYSALADAARSLKQEVGSPQQMLNMLTNTKGVKQAEIDATGLADYLALKGKNVTKQDIVNYVENNGVQIEEKLLGEIDPSKINMDSPYASVPEVMDIVNKNQGEAQDALLMTLANDGDAYRALTSKYPYLHEVDNWAEEVLQSLTHGETNNLDGVTKYSEYQLGGNSDNYRELLLKLPLGKMSDEQAGERTYEMFMRNGGMPSWDSLPPESKQNVINSLEGYEKNKQPKFRSAHFDEPNVLAHVRFNDRVDADGKKVLFIEELQSDWAQKGRKEGFEGGKTVEDAKKFFDIPDDRWATLSQEYRQSYLDEMNSGDVHVRGIARAPFVTSTDAWTSLASKRLLRYAAENGYDRVAWTTGTQQADRYDLSKKISKLEYIDGYIVAHDTGGNRVINERADIEDLPDIVGKEVAEKIANKQKEIEYDISQWHPEKNEETGGWNLIDPNGEYVYTRNGHLEEFKGEDDAMSFVTDQQEHQGSVVLSGLDLKIGGEGMKGFYDTVIPKTLKKVMKQAGGNTEIKDVELQNAYMEKKGSFWMVHEGDSFTRFDTKARAQKHLDSVKKQETLKQPSVEITPELRHTLMKKGLPLFSTGTLGASMALDQYKEMQKKNAEGKAKMGYQ